MKQFFIFFLLSIAMSFGSYKSQVIRIRSTQDFMEGKGEHLAFLQEGGITFSSSIKKILDSPEAFLWTLARSERGGLTFVGTGQRGLILIYDAHWNLVRQVILPAVNITTLLPSSGLVYAAGFPSGRVFSVDTQGKVKEVAQLAANYVWKLFKRKGKVYALTGEPACLFQLLPKKKKIFCGEAGHFLDGLPIGKNFLITSGNPAALLEIDPAGKAIARVAFDGEDAYAVVGDGRRFFVAVNEQQLLSSKQAEKNDASQSRKVLEGKYQDPSFSKAIFPTKKKRNEISAKVYQIEEGKLPRVILDVGDPVVTSLFLKGQELYVGTGNQGMLYRYNLTSEQTEALVMPSRQLLSLSQAENQLWIVAGNPAALYSLNQKKKADSFSYLSKIVDLHSGSYLGRAGSIGTMPNASVSLRAGNTPEPDGTWTDWFLPGEAPKVFFRYFQFKVEASRQESNGSITELYTFVHPLNRQPRILSLDLQDPKAPPGSKSSESGVLQTTRKGKKKLVIKASDPDHDRLLYDIYLKKEQGETIPLARSLSVPVYEIDFKKLPEGVYRLKVQASDRLSNAVSEALSDVLMTHPFTIDRTAPTIQYQQKGGSLIFTVQEKLSFVASARITYRGMTQRLLPDDGLFDEPEEVFTVPLKKLTFPLFFRAQDDDENTATLWVEQQHKEK